MERGRKEGNGGNAGDESDRGGGTLEEQRRSGQDQRHLLPFSLSRSVSFFPEDSLSARAWAHVRKYKNEGKDRLIESIQIKVSLRGGAD